MRKTLAFGIGAIALAAPTLAFVPSASANDDHHPWYPRCARDIDQFNYISGSNVNDYLVGTDWSDWIRGRGGNDIITGKDCNDILSGNRGNDVLRAVDNYRDFVNGGRGTDRCVGDVFDNFTSCETVILRSPFPG